jgi:hypothetical protein
MSDSLNLAGGLLDAIARLPRTTFTLPESVRLAGDPKTVTIRQLTVSEIKAAMEAKHFGEAGAKRGLYAVDGKVVTWTDNEAETIFDGFSNKVRDLVIKGFGKVCLPNQEETDSFFGSAKTEV